MFEQYGHQAKGLKVQYYINGKSASYREVLDDFRRGEDYLFELMLQYANKDEESN